MGLKREPSFYAVLCLVIPIWGITPLSWVYFVYQIWTHGPSGVRFLWGNFFFVWALFEILFSLYHSYLVSVINRSPPSIPPADMDRLRVLFAKILHTGLHEDAEKPRDPSFSTSFEAIPQLEYSDPRALDFRQTLTTWFHKSSFASLSRTDFTSWLSWSMFGSEYTNTLPSQKLMIEAALEMLERRAGTTIPENPPERDSGTKLNPLRLTLDPFTVWSRPLVAYLVINLAAQLNRQWLKWRYHVRYEHAGEVEYLVRMPLLGDSTSDPKDGTATNTDQSPILFLHGLGIGLLQYQVLISDILSLPKFHKRTILIPLQPHISQSIFHPSHLKPVSPTATVESLKEMIQKVTTTMGKEKGQMGVTVLSHSNGTSVHAWLLKNSPTLVKRSCFVDPVIFCLWEGDVCYNFVYKPPTNGIEVLMRYFVGTELGIAHTIQRKFDWTTNTLFFDEIPSALDPNKAQFYLGGKDSIVAAHRVKRYLVSHGVKPDGPQLHYNPSAAHGEALITGGESLESIMDWLTGNVQPK